MSSNEQQCPPPLPALIHNACSHPSPVRNACQQAVPSATPPAARTCAYFVMSGSSSGSSGSTWSLGRPIMEPISTEGSSHGFLSSDV
jgi:hypothetical protein